MMAHLTPVFRRAVFISCVAYFVFASGLGALASIYSIARLGFLDEEHTRNDGYAQTTATTLIDAGTVIGQSVRYNGGSSELGQTAWFYDGRATRDIGFVGSEFTRADGAKYSFAQKLNNLGQVVGYSVRYDGGANPIGLSVWIFDGATTKDIGYAAEEFGKSNRSSSYVSFNDAGYVCGFARRSFVGSGPGNVVWLYDGSATKIISLTDDAHTRSDGFQSSSVYGMNAHGHVIGSTDRFVNNLRGSGTPWMYDGSSTFEIGPAPNQIGNAITLLRSFPHDINDANEVIGHSIWSISGAAESASATWLFDGVSTHIIGLTGPGYIGKGGIRLSDVRALNNAGQAIGVSNRYNSFGYYVTGRSVWFYNGAATIDIGLAGDEFRARAYSEVWGLSESGKVIGYSRRTNGGQSAWLYDGARTIEIGLTGSEFTGPSGSRDVNPMYLNEGGQVSGIASRLVSNGGGDSAWFFDGVSSVEIGIIDSVHTRSDGYRRNIPETMNEQGQVTGTSPRYNGGDGSKYMGWSAWFYDPTLKKTFPLVLSTGSDGYAYSKVEYLGEDGLALGVYALINNIDNSISTRAFGFDAMHGMRDLGSLVDGGLSVNGWSYLAHVVRNNGRGQVLGHGVLGDQTGGQFAYLLTPIPEPTSSSSVGTACLILACISLSNRTRQTVDFCRSRRPT